jgi:hypothetical protein
VDIRDQMFCFIVLFNDAFRRPEYMVSDVPLGRKWCVEICEELSQQCALQRIWFASVDKKTLWQDG